MLKRLAVVLGALALTSGLMLAGAGSASAADKKQYPTCGKGGFCVWESYDGDTSYRHRTEGNAPWPSGFKNDDYLWRNNGYYQPGADHVRVYNAAPPGGVDVVTLCIHRGHQGGQGDNADTRNAAGKGDFHRWGGECSSSEPQL
ncbi:hypothetical protein [Aeromicrobium sp. CTD01-1L150]|uniref:hypothetical protein n=1 Tax=Aeromicrobium sp. CTD01-1L150 TaxID=3341830 RepID=UPI0035C16372